MEKSSNSNAERGRLANDVTKLDHRASDQMAIGSAVLGAGTLVALNVGHLQKSKSPLGGIIAAAILGAIGVSTLIASLVTRRKAAVARSKLADLPSQCESLGAAASNVNGQFDAFAPSCDHQGDHIEADDKWKAAVTGANDRLSRVR